MYRIAPADMLFIILTTLKSGASWQFRSTKVNNSISTCKRLLKSVIETVADDFHDHAVVAVGKNPENVSGRAKLSIFVSSVYC